MPFDHGVVLINGRPGARFGPKKIKQEFFKLTKRQKYFKDVCVIDYGNIIPVSKNVKKTHEKVTLTVKRIIKDGVIPVVIGGSHDISFGSVKSMFWVYKKFVQINIDAHYDVRPVVNGKITSGTPFRRLLEGKYLCGKDFVELGIHAPKNLPEHSEYLKKQKATLIKLDFINKIGIEKSMKIALAISGKNTNTVVFDIDIDGVMKRFAPGCSAPGIQGFTKKQILQAAYIAGKNKNVKLFNLMEVSPVHDINNKTVKLAAQIVLAFIKGLNKRRV